MDPRHVLSRPREKDLDWPSSRGVGARYLYPRARPGELPRWPFYVGSTGDRDASMDVTASQLSQITKTDDDVRYDRSVHDNPPHKVLVWFIQEAMDDDDDDVDEASVASNVSGYVLPLGATNHPGQESWRYYARSFGRAEALPHQQWQSRRRTRQRQQNKRRTAH